MTIAHDYINTRYYHSVGGYEDLDHRLLNHTDLIVLAQLSTEWVRFMFKDFGIDTKRASKHLRDMEERGLIESKKVEGEWIPFIQKHILAGGADYAIAYKLGKDIEPLNHPAVEMFRESISYKNGYAEKPTTLITAKDFVILLCMTEELRAHNMSDFGVNQARVGKHLRDLRDRGLLLMVDPEDLEKFGSVAYRPQAFGGGKALHEYALGEAVTKNDIASIRASNLGKAHVTRWLSGKYDLISGGWKWYGGFSEEVDQAEWLRLDLKHLVEWEQVGRIRQINLAMNYHMKQYMTA